jgi:V/A-type H+-transporting ATPase subunit E
MKNLEAGRDKVRKICEALKKETLEPAKHEAEELVASARRHADEILADAKDEAERIVESARLEIERQRNIFQASLSQACRQTLETLKEKIEEKLFNPELRKLILKPMQDPKMIAQLITSVVKAIDKEGLEADLSAYIPSAVPAKDVNQLLASEIIQRLKEKGVLLSPIGGGIEVRIVQDNITIELSDAALKELVANYIRKDFRELVFGG